MKLRRSRADDVPTPDPEDVAFCLDIAVLLRDGLETYRRLFREFEVRGSDADLGATALATARKYAAWARLGYVSAERLHANLGESMWPDRALAVLRRLGYALVALGEEAPDVATLLTEEQVEQVVAERNVAEWHEFMLARLPADWSVGGME